MKRCPTFRRCETSGEHIDEYAIEKGRDRNVNRRALQAGSFGKVTLDWLGGRLDADAALAAAEALHRAIKVAS